MVTFIPPSKNTADWIWGSLKFELSTFVRDLKLLFKKKMKSFLVKAFYLNFAKKASVSLISSLKIAQFTASFP